MNTDGAAPSPGGWRRGLGAGYLRVWSFAHAVATAWRRRVAGAPWPLVPLEPLDVALSSDGGGALHDEPRGRRRRVLIVSPYSLHPPIHGGAVRIGNLIRRLARDVDVYLLIFIGGTDDPEQAAAFAEHCRDVFFVQQPSRSAPDPWGLRPAAVDAYTAETTQERIAALVDAHQIDVVMLEYTELSAYRGPYPGASVVLVEHDVGFRTQARQRALDFGRRFAGRFAARAVARDLDRLRRAEVRACRAVARVHTMSEDDARYLAPHLGRATMDRLRVVPNGVDTTVYQPAAHGERPPHDVLFVGSFPHLPNRDALAYFVAEIWPLVRQRHPAVRLTVAGARPTDDVLAHDGMDGITVAGEVDHLAPLYRSHTVLVVPLRAGSGTRLKIMEALASGIPVVSTTLGAEGIVRQPTDSKGSPERGGTSRGASGATSIKGLPERGGTSDGTSDESLVLADGATAFAVAVGDLLDDPDRCQRLAATGRALVSARYDWDAIARGLAADLATLVPDATLRAASDPSPHEAHSAPSVVVSVVVLTGTGRDRLPAALEAVSAQRLGSGSDPTHTGGSVEVVVVSRDDEPIPTFDGLSMDVISVATGLADGLAFNRGCQHARGTILALLTADAVPVGTRWLADLIAPFTASAPPSVVQGGVHERFVANGPAHHLAATAPERTWDAEHGFAFSWSNAAVPKRVWQHQPFGATADVETLRWQRRLTASGHLMLPIFDVRVEQLQPWTLGGLVAHGWRRGGALRHLGFGYHPGELLQDLASPRSFDQGRRWLLTRPVHSRAERLMPWLRPLALFAGRWLRRSSRTRR